MTSPWTMSSRSWATEPPGEDYKCIHPPLDEGNEPDCPIRQLVTPIEGAKKGDRIRYVQFTDSVYFAPDRTLRARLDVHVQHSGVSTPVPCPVGRSSR